MANWPILYEHEECPPEILVGMYDHWLSRLARGPSQAERVLYHTPIMELAHERRFAIGQSKQGMQDFEVEHRQRIANFVDGLHTRFSASSCRRMSGSASHHDPYLIGLSPLPTEAAFVSSFPSPVRNDKKRQQSMEEALQKLAVRSSTTMSQSTMPPEGAIDVDDSDNLSDRQQEEWMEAIKTVSKRSQRAPIHKPRTMKDVKRRREPMPCTAYTGNAKDPPRLGLPRVRQS